jgi:hypothetical protein
MIASAELVKRVRRLLNEAEEDAHLSLLSEDTRSIDEHIMRLLPQAVAFVQKNKAPGCGNVNARAADSASALLDDRGDGCAVLALPDDFAHLVSLQLKGWKRPCRLMLGSDSGEAVVRSNGYVPAGVHRPLCVEGVAGDGSRIAILSPLPDGGRPQLECFVYEAVFDADRGLEGCDATLADAVVYYCAALLYSVFERQDQANAFLSLATLLCNGKVGERR